MNTFEFEEIILGDYISEAIVSGKYGNVQLWQADQGKQWVVGDPSYWSNGNFYRRLYSAANRITGFTFRNQEWTAFEYQDQTCYFRNQTDGTGDFGLSVDSSWLVAVPVRLAPEHVREALTSFLKLIP